MADTLLSLRDVRAGYGDGVVLDGISFDVPQRGSLAILGRNGMGKTTLLLTLMGHTRLHSGSMQLGGAPFEAIAPHRRASLGLGWVPQERDIFRSLNVEENLTIATRRGEWTKERVFALFPRLAERRGNRGDQLSGGEQQMLAIGRALMSNPRVLLLDEPFEGLAPIIIDELEKTIRALTAMGIGMLLVEQHVDTALQLTDAAVVLEGGTVAFSGASSELAARQDLIDQYIGL
jgi:branched-chain amino acid transport system ATP-binding protein